MRNFFYAPLIALMLLFASCADSDGIDDGTGDEDSIVDVAAFVTQPQDVSFNTNLERWEAVTVTFSVDPGPYRVSLDSFSWKENSDVSYGDYFTASIKQSDVDNEFVITFRSLSGAETLTDSLEVPMTLVMTYSGFTQIESDTFNVILPADKYSPYFVSEPSDAIFKAGFYAGDVCETSFEINPEDAIYGDMSFFIEENENFSVSIVEGEQENEYVARFKATDAFRTKADEALTAYGEGTPVYDYNLSVNETVSIVIVTEGVEVEQDSVSSVEFVIIAELADVKPTFVNVSDVDFGHNFEIDEPFIGTIEIDPGTKNITRYDFDMTTDDNYSIYNFAVSDATNNIYSVYLYPTELSIGEESGDEGFEVEATISLVYDDYGESVTIYTDPIKVIFGEDMPELPSFTTLPTDVTFPTGSDVSTTISSTFVLDDGTYTNTTSANLSIVANDYYTATFEATGNKDEYTATFTLTDAAFNLALGAESVIIGGSIRVTCSDGEIVNSDSFDIEIGGRLDFNYYLYNLTHNSVIVHVNEFTTSSIQAGDIDYKGVYYTTNKDADISEWTQQQVEYAPSYSGSSPTVGEANAYECVLADLEPNTTYYIMPYVIQSDNGAGTSYGEAISVTTYASAASVPKLGNITWSWSTEPTDATVKAAMESSVNEAINYYNIYAAYKFSFNVSFDSSTSSYISDLGVMCLTSSDYSVGRIMNLMMSLAGVGNSTWTSSMTSGSYYSQASANEFYQLITNQYSSSSTAKMQATSSGIHYYDLVTGGTGSATLAPASATTASMVKLAKIMGHAYDDGLSGYVIPDGMFSLIDGVNVALNKAATANVSATGYDVSNIVDGDKFSLDSRWLSSSSTPAWVQIDLGEEYSIIGFNFYGGTGSVTAPYYYDTGVTDYTFQYFNSNTNSWVDIISVEGQSSYLGCFSKTFDEPVTCSVVRLYITGNNHEYQMRVFELEVMTDYIK